MADARLDPGTLSAALAAMNAAAPSAKSAAYMTAVVNRIGTGYLTKLVRGTAVIAQLPSSSGTLAQGATALTIAQATVNSLLAASPSDALAVRIERNDGSAWIQIPMPAAATLSGSVAAASSIALGPFTLNFPGATGGGGGGGLTRFGVGNHMHGTNYANNANYDRHATGAFPYMPAGRTMEPAQFGPQRSHNVELLNALEDGTFVHQCHWTGRTGGISATGDGKNQYDWTRFDRWVLKVTGRGHRIALNLYGVPAWAARRPDITDQYGVAGGSSWVPNPDAWLQFARDTAQRIVNLVGAQWIESLSPWNEPLADFDAGVRSNFLTGDGYTGGITRLWADIVEFSVLGWRSIAALANTPIWVGEHNYMSEDQCRRIMSARTTSNKSVVEYATHWSWHPYGFQDFVADANGVTLTSMKAMLDRLSAEYGGANLGHVISEYGIFNPWHPPFTAWWQGLSQAERGAAILATTARAKALQFSGIVFYSLDEDNNPGLIGSPAINRACADGLTSAYLTHHVD